jgi:hypothetical protein
MKDPNYFMTIEEFLRTSNPEMPADLIKLIMKWDKIKKSPYGNTSYYNAAKTWESFVHRGIRVSDHWNFYSQGNIHCQTMTPIRSNDRKWRIGI